MSENLFSIEAVHAVVESRMIDQVTDFELAERELDGAKLTNDLELPPTTLEEGVGHTVHSIINGTLYTGPVEFDAGKFTSNPQYEAGSTVEAIVVGMWPQREQAAVYHVIRPMDNLELSKSTPARPILRQVLETGLGLGYEKLPGDPDGIADLYVFKHYAEPIDFSLTDGTRLVSSQVLDDTEASGGQSGELVYITLEGSVEINNPPYYIKVDEGGVKETRDFTSDPLEIVFPEELATFQVVLPEAGSKVHIWDQRLIAVRPGFESILEDERTLEALCADALQDYPLERDSLDKKYGIVVLPNPQIDVAGHPIVAEAQGWKDWTDFTSRYRDTIEKLMHDAQLAEARDIAKQRMLAALNGEDSQPATDAHVIGSLEVADYIRTHL